MRRHSTIALLCRHTQLNLWPSSSEASNGYQFAPEFALAAGTTGLCGITNGYGYDITGADVLDAYVAVMQAACAAGVDETVVKADVRALIAASRGGGEFSRVLARQLAT